MIPVYMKKAINDLSKHKARTFIIIVSITLCLSIVGTLLNTKLLFEQVQVQSMKSTNAADLTYYTNTFQGNISFINKIDGVKSAEPKFETRARAEIGQSEKNFELSALPKAGAFHINQIQLPEQHTPGQNEIYLDQSTLSSLHLKKGDQINITMPGESKKTLKIKGAVKDYYRTPITYSGIGFGYLSNAAFQKLGVEPGFNKVQITLKSGLNQQKASGISGKVSSALKQHGISVSRTEQSLEPFFLRKTMADSILLLLIILGGLSLILGIILVIHLFYRMIAEQTFEMSVMKVLGARPFHFWFQYGAALTLIGTMVFVFSSLISGAASWYFSNLLIQQLNMGELHFSYSRFVLAASFLLSFLVPTFAAIFPIAHIVRIKAADGLQKMSTKTFKRTKKRNSGHFFNYRVLSYRNAFTKKFQLLTNILMLSFGGAVIIACIALNSSLLSTLKGIQNYWNYNLEWDVKAPLPSDRLISLTEKIDHVEKAEGWTTRNTELTLSGSKENHNALLIALPSQTKMIRPTIKSGNWFKDKNSIVVNKDLEQLVGNVKPGDQVTLKIGDKTKKWKIGGIMNGQLNGPAIYMDQNAYSGWMKNSFSNRIVAKIASPEEKYSHKALNDADRIFSRNHIDIEGVDTASGMTDRPLQIIQLIYYAILAVGALFVIVGAFNLMTAMSVNVLERRKEIGVIRSMGGSRSKIYGLFMGEGILIAVISWGLSVALAYPLHLFLSRKVGESLLHDSLTNVFPLSGIVFWLTASILIGIFASVLPANKAASEPLRKLL
ncbi:FtsX-like permease family protein [Metabacillus sp. RGM 3146]|uniref:ABC transporter permease n=1 Tax=Metabacillus sp. RGM 3146 TaxID=3401092 RepID=UPI003B9CD28B